MKYWRKITVIEWAGLFHSSLAALWFVQVLRGCLEWHASKSLYQSHPKFESQQRNKEFASKITLSLLDGKQAPPLPPLCSDQWFISDHFPIPFTQYNVLAEGAANLNPNALVKLLQFSALIVPDITWTFFNFLSKANHTYLSEEF